MRKITKSFCFIVSVLFLANSLCSAALYVADMNNVYLLDFNEADIFTLVHKQEVVIDGSIKDIAADDKGNVYVAHSSANPTQVSKYNATSWSTLYTKNIDYSGLSDDTLHKMAWTSYNSGQILSKRSGSPSVVGFFDDSDLSWDKQYSITYAWDFVAADSSYIYLGQSSGKKVYIYDLATGDFVRSLTTSYSINNIAADNQGYIYLSVAGKILMKYDAATLTLQSSYQYSSTAKTVQCIVFNPDDDYLYMVSGGATWQRYNVNSISTGYVKQGNLGSVGIASIITGAGGVLTPDPVTCEWLIGAEFNLQTDLSGDCFVDFKDFAMFAEDWLKSGL